jgi:uncharacterized protein
MKPEKEYFEHLAAGRFMLLRSRSTGKHLFYPRVAVPGTGETDLEWVPASGKGTVYSTTVIRQKPPTPNYNVALIDLEEGVRMMARVDGIAPEDVKIGQRVQARVLPPKEGSSEVPMVVFDPA